MLRRTSAPTLERGRIPVRPARFVLHAVTAGRVEGIRSHPVWRFGGVPRGLLSTCPVVYRRRPASRSPRGPCSRRGSPVQAAPPPPEETWPAAGSNRLSLESAPLASSPPSPRIGQGYTQLLGSSPAPCRSARVAGWRRLPAPARYKAAVGPP